LTGRGVRAAALIAGLVLCSGSALAADVPYAKLPGAASFVSALKYEDQTGGTAVQPSALMTRPVTNADFLAFVQQHPRWQRDKVPALLAEARYLSHWAAPTRLANPAQALQPVTWVSWFAARAYCEAQGGEAQGARLPTWSDKGFGTSASDAR
jgi:formylglycine-generating enzyme